MPPIRSAVVALTLSLGLAAPLAAARGTLRGSPASMVRQHEVAKEEDFTFLRTPGQVERFLEEGYLVPIEGNGDYEIARGVSFPAARPELRVFLERLGAQYRAACGEALVVTSLTRPLSTQPRNAHPLSVHPAGMAADFRISRRGECRAWLESALLGMEERRLLDVTRERRPPHYHVAVFPAAYMAWVERAGPVTAKSSPASEAAAAPAPTRPAEPASRGAAAPAAPRQEDGGPAGPVLVTAAYLVLGLHFLLRRRRGSLAETA